MFRQLAEKKPANFENAEFNTAYTCGFGLCQKYPDQFVALKKLLKNSIDINNKTNEKQIKFPQELQIVTSRQGVFIIEKLSVAENEAIARDTKKKVIKRLDSDEKNPTSIKVEHDGENFLTYSYHDMKMNNMKMNIDKETRTAVDEIFKNTSYSNPTDEDQINAWKEILMYTDENVDLNESRLHNSAYADSTKKVAARTFGTYIGNMMGDVIDPMLGGTGWGGTVGGMVGAWGSGKAVGWYINDGEKKRDYSISDVFFIIKILRDNWTEGPVHTSVNASGLDASNFLARVEQYKMKMKTTYKEWKELHEKDSKESLKAVEKSLFCGSGWCERRDVTYAHS